MRMHAPTGMKSVSIGDLGVMVNTGGGTLVDMPAAQAAQYWGTGAQAGQIYQSGGVNYGYNGYGWTTTGVQQPMLGGAAKPPVQIPGAGGFEMSLSPGMMMPTSAPSLATALQDAVNESSSPFIVNNIIGGSTTAQQEAQYIIDKAGQWAALHPDLAAAVDWKSAAQSAAGQYLSWVSAGAAQYSSSNGGLIPYLGPGAGVNQGSSYIGPVAGAPSAGAAPPPVMYGGGNTPAYLPQQTVTPTQPTSVLHPPTSQTPVTQQSVANTQTQGAGANLTTRPGGDVSDGAPFDIMTWMKDNWIIVAAGAALLIVPSMIGKK